jgi:DNA polymerase-1
VDFQSLVGDVTDNIPGVAKVGPKTATELLQQFGTLEGIYDNIAIVTGKKKEYLLAGKESAFLSRQLVTLKNDLPVQVEWKDYGGFDAEKLRVLFQRFGFKSLLGKLEGDPKRGETLFHPHPSPARPARTPEGEETTQRPSTLGERVVYHLIDTPEKFAEFFMRLGQQSIFAIDTETAPMELRFEATSPRYTVIVGMSFAWNDHEAWYLPFRGPLGSQTLPMQQTLEQLRPILENPEVKKIGQNLKYDKVVLKNAGVHLQGVAFDTMLADYLLRN